MSQSLIQATLTSLSGNIIWVGAYSHQALKHQWNDFSWSCIWQTRSEVMICSFIWCSRTIQVNARVKMMSRSLHLYQYDPYVFHHMLQMNHYFGETRWNPKWRHSYDVVVARLMPSVVFLCMNHLMCIVVDSGVKWQTFLVGNLPNTGPRFVHNSAAQFGEPTEFTIKVC